MKKTPLGPFVLIAVLMIEALSYVWDRPATVDIQASRRKAEFFLESFGYSQSEIKELLSKGDISHGTHE